MRLTRLLVLLAGIPCALIAAPAAADVASTTPFSLGWTAPGDDGLVGRASLYQLRCSTAPLTAANFGLAAIIPGMPAPAIAGTRQTFMVSGLFDSVGYYLAIKTVDEAGNWSAISNVFNRPASGRTLSVPTLALSFSSPYPNPARESVNWAFSLPQAAHVRVDVYDVLGRHVHTVEDSERRPGADVLSWNLRDEGGQAVGAGLYFVRARIGPATWTKRLTVVH